MFIVYVQSETNPKISNGYYTNTVMSKNDGALVAFRDRFGNMHNIDPTRVSIKLNVDDKSHLAKNS